MSYWLSEPIEALVANHKNGECVGRCDVLVVGSGYGGAMAAMRLAGATPIAASGNAEPINVLLFERGKEYAQGDFAESVGELPGHIRFKRGGAEPPTGYAEGLFDFRIGNPVSVLVGNGLGGTSLINAGVALEPDEEVFSDPGWPTALRNKAELYPSFKEVRRLLDVTDARTDGIKKYRALERIAQAVGADCKPAPIAVSYRTGENTLGVAQKECIECGNCVTGCNYGAKNTLPMNVLPLARNRGAKIYTGATVLSIEPADGIENGSAGWVVRFQRTVTVKTPIEEEFFTVRTRCVVLAAGTLGSTEILLRSRQLAGLKLSDRLGQRFSTNGDAIAFGYGQATEVNAVAHSDFADEPGPVNGRKIGPTITGYFKAFASPGESQDRTYHVTVEEAAVPSALAAVFGEIVATSALPNRLVTAGLNDPLRPAWFETPENRDKDPLAVHPGALRHSQVLLAMGDDGASGNLCLRHPVGRESEHDRAGVEVVWRSGTDPCTYDSDRWRAEAQSSVFAAIDSLLREADDGGGDGFDGGDYLASPLWRPLPPEIKQVASPPEPPYLLIAVHPLGGCPMGDDRRSGVVDHLGRVFKASEATPAATYHGLYVFDGAAIPGAVATNPFLTIAAFAHRAAGHVLGEHGWTESTQAKVTDSELKSPPVSRSSIPLPAHRVSARFTEQLIGRLDRVPRWLRETLTQEDNGKVIAQLSMERGLVLRVGFEFRNVHEFLRDTRKPLPAFCELYANWVPTATIPRSHLEGMKLAEGPGSVEIMAWDRPANLGEEWARALLAVQALIERRAVRDVADACDPNLAARGRNVDRALHMMKTMLLPGALPVDAAKMARVLLSLQLDVLHTTGPLQALALGGSRAQAASDDIEAMIATMQAFWSMARHHAQWRTLRYSFNLTGARGAFTLEGTKELAFASGKKNPWAALIELPVTLRNPVGWGAVRGEVCADLIDLSSRPALQVTSSPDTPASVLAMASFGLLSMRALFQTHLWSFRTPSYPRQPLVPDTQPQPLLLADGRRVPPTAVEVISVRKPDKDPVEGDIYIRLVRYRPSDPKRGAILLIHGFAHGSSLFTTDTIPVSFASYLYDAGYDVWVLDHRLSNLLRDTRSQATKQWLAELQTTIDEVAKYDIAKAIGFVYEASGRPIQVLAHCVGAAATSMAVLGSLCHDAQHTDPRTGKVVPRSKIGALALHAVPPWLVASMPNRLRANLAAFLKDAVRQETVNPVPRPDPSALEIVVDSLCSSFPWPTEGDLHRHDSDTDGRHGREICARYNAIYGLEWHHDNLAPRTHRRLDQLVGVGNLETFKQIFFMTLRQRITDREGANVYLQETTLEERWTFPTLFAHGSDNGVFASLSSVRSFIRLSLLRAKLLDQKPPLAPDKCGVYLFESPGFGHLDFLFGKDAPYKVYPYVEGFFRIAGALSGNTSDPHQHVLAELARQSDVESAIERDPHWRAPEKPECGPIIGWSRRDNDRVKLRIWVEAVDHTTSPPKSMSAGRRGTSRVKLPKAGADYPGTFFVYDVPVAPETAHIDVKVVYGGRRVKSAEARPTSLDPLAAAFDTTGKPLAKPEDALRRIKLCGVPWFDRLSKGGARSAVSFLVGSCRYPGSPFERDMADRIYHPMLAHVGDGADATTQPGIDHVLLVGDQIYADATVDMFDTREPRERFAGRYREMLQSPNLRELLRSVPCAMAIDDHELADNWPGLDEGEQPDEQILSGFVAATAYLWASSSQAGNPDGCGLWYHFESGGLPFFVLDTRTQRKLRTASNAASAELMSKQQLDALTTWLTSNKARNVPLFIVCGSPIALVARAEADKNLLWRNADGWIGYPATLSAVMRTIVSEGLPNVVFVSGDSHFSAAATLRLEFDGKTVTAYQVVSSGFFVPLPFANRRESDYEWNQPVRIVVDTVSMTITSTLLSTACQQFMRIDASESEGAWSATLRLYGVAGQQLHEHVLF